MLEPVANIKTVLIEGICSPVNCFHSDIAGQNVVSTVKKLYGKHHDLVDPYNVVVFKRDSDLLDSVEA